MRIAAAITAFMLALGVAGCSADEAEPATLPAVGSGSASAPPSTPGPPTPTSAATSSKSYQPDWPNTPEGASAFTMNFFEAVNAAYVDGDPNSLTRLSHPDCNSCSSIVADVARVRDAGLTVEGKRFDLQFAEQRPSTTVTLWWTSPSPPPRTSSVVPTGALHGESQRPHKEGRLDSYAATTHGLSSDCD